MSYTQTSFNNSSDGSYKPDFSTAPRPTRSQIEKYNKEQKRKVEEQELKELSIPATTEDPLKEGILEKDFNAMVVQNNPYLDTLKRWAGNVQNFGKSTWEATTGIAGNFGGISKIGLSKGTSNPFVTSIIAGGGSIVAGLLSAKSLIATFRSWNDAKQPVPWVINLGKSILEGGIGLSLALPIFNKGQSSPLVKNVDGENIVQLKSLFGALAAIIGLDQSVKISQGQSPINKIPLFGSLLKDILSAGVSTTKELTTSPGLPNQQQGIPGGGLPQQ